MSKQIPPETIHTFARSIFREAGRYGFSGVDVIRLVNELMDLCTQASESMPGTGGDRDVAGTELPGAPVELPLTGERVRIRRFDPAGDSGPLESWLPDRYGRFFVLSSVSAQAITIEALTDSTNNHLGIVTDLEDRPIGAMAFLDHSREQRRAELRKLIGDVDARGQGLAEEATRLWLQYGMTTLGLEKIYVSTLQTHISNIKLNEDIGFRMEGLLRNEVLIDGERHDVLRMGFWLE